MPLFHRPSLRSIIARALLLGITAGMRSQTPIAALARYQPQAPRGAEWAHWPLLRSRFGRVLLQLGWLGELVADKLPVTPPRTNPGSLGGRITSGAIVGLAAGSERHGTGAKLGGALVGAVGAVVGTYGGYHARKLAVETSGLPDLSIALVEDGTAATLARAAVRG